MRRARPIWLALVISCLLALPAGAQAGELTRVDGTVVFDEAEFDMSVNDVFVGVFSGTDHLIWDANEPVTDVNADSGCTNVGGTFWNCGSASFRIVLGGGSDQFRASAGASHSPSISPVTVLGGGGNDSITGGNGNDIFDGGAGSDSMTGGAGSDLVTYASRTSGVTVYIGQAGSDDGSAEDGMPGARDTIHASDVEGVVGSAGADTLLGSAKAESIDGGPGGDSINALAGADTVRGGDGADNIEARDGEADDVDCGADEDVATTDGVDTRANCDPPPVTPQTIVVTTPAPPAPPSRLFFDLAYTFSAGRLGTTLRNVGLEIEPGARLTAFCRTRRGRRCTGVRDLTRARAAASVRLRGLEGKRLPVGARIRISVTKDGMIGVAKTLTIRRRRAPSVRTLCIPPGGTAASAC